jgi:hypothetical protein
LESPLDNDIDTSTPASDTPASPPSHATRTRTRRR